MNAAHYRARLAWESIGTLGLGLTGAGLAALLLDGEPSPILVALALVDGIYLIGLSIAKRAPLLAQEDADERQ